MDTPKPLPDAAAANPIPDTAASGRSPMRLALDAAAAAARRGEVPVGAVVLDGAGEVLAVAGNETEAARDASAHAELLAMRRAAAKRGGRLAGCTLVATLEPCPMCAAASLHFRVARVVFGAYDPKGGGVEHGARIFDAANCSARPEVVGGVCEGDAAALLHDFFRARR